jgi:hypothetical protein
MSDRILSPASLEETTRRDLLNGLTTHEAVLVEAQHGIGPPRATWDLRAAALGALAHGRALAGSALRREWTAQVEALRNDVILADVAVACGLEPDEVIAGLRSRVSVQVAQGLMTRATGREILTLIDMAIAGSGADSES